jgi:hypothetical protein
MSTTSWLMNVYYRRVEPHLFRARRRRVLDAFGIATTDDVAEAHFDLLAADEAIPGCMHLARSHAAYLRKFARAGHDDTGKGLACLIDLSRFADFAAYERGVRTRSGRSDFRKIQRAASAGYTVRPFARALHAPEMAEIAGSKLFRSGGMVLDALAHRLKRLVGRSVESATAAPDDWMWTPGCPRHWTADLGIFTPGEGGSPGRLVGVIALRRAGDTVRTKMVWTHADHLAVGAMKLLMHETLRWLLDRSDPNVAGLRWLHYGAAEHGGEGLLAWKRRFGFMPYRVSWTEQ